MGGSDAAVARRLRIVGIVARQVGELLALARPRHQVLGFLLGGGGLFGRLALGGDQNLAEEDLLLAHELASCARRSTCAGPASGMLIREPTSWPITRCARHCLFMRSLEVLERHAVLLLDQSLELVGVGDLGAHLHVAPIRAFTSGSTLMLRSLALLHQQQLVDLVAQGVRRALLHGLRQLRARQSLGPQLYCSSSLRCLLQFAAGDDVAVHLGGDLLHHAHIRSDGDRKGRRDEYYKPAKHNSSPILPVSRVLQRAIGRQRPTVPVSPTENRRISPAAVWPSRGSSNTPAGVNCAPRVLPTIFMSRAGSTRVSLWNFIFNRLWRRSTASTPICSASVLSAE